jgi:hypothetical protein
VSEGLEGTPETRLLEGLCARLTATGLPLVRVNISQPTLHPVIGGHLFIWQRDIGHDIAGDRSRAGICCGAPFRHHTLLANIQVLVRLRSSLASNSSHIRSLQSTTAVDLRKHCRRLLKYQGSDIKKRRFCFSNALVQL